MLHSRDGVLWVMCCVGFAPNVTFCILTAKIRLGFVRPQNLFPYGFRISGVGCFLYTSNENEDVLFLCHGFLPATLPSRPDLWSAGDLVVTSTQ